MVQKHLLGRNLQVPWDLHDNRLFGFPHAHGANMLASTHAVKRNISLLR